MTAFRRLMLPLFLVPFGMLPDAMVRAQEIWLAPQPKAVDLFEIQAGRSRSAPSVLPASKNLI